MKYNWPIIGHSLQLQRIEADIKHNNLSHAYLFAGPEKIGKYKIAKTYAQILQCKENFCKECQVCKEIQKEIHLDTLSYKNNGEVISIESIRDLHTLISRSHQSNYRIIIMEDIERMPIPSQNAFLKILEEPPPKTIFLLTTSKVFTLLDTILSRTRTLNFYHLEDNILKQELEKRLPNEIDRIENILALSQGKTGLAIDLAEDYELFDEKLALYQQIESLLTNSSHFERFQAVERIYQSTRAIKMFLETFLFILRNILTRSLASDSYTPPLELGHTIALIESTDEAMAMIEKNVNKRLVLENLMLTF